MARWVPDPWSTLFLELPRPLWETGWSDWTDKRQFGSLLSWNCEFDWLNDAEMKPSEAERFTRCPWVPRSLKIRSSGPECDVQLKIMAMSHTKWVTWVELTSCKMGHHLNLPVMQPPLDESFEGLRSNLRQMVPHNIYVAVLNESLLWVTKIIDT